MSLRRLFKNCEVKIPGDEAVNSMNDSSEQELNERWRNRNLKEKNGLKMLFNCRESVERNLLAIE